MQVFLRTTTSALTCLTLPDTATVADLSELVSSRFCLAEEGLMMLRGGKPLLALEDGCIIDMSGKLLGGAGPPAKTQMDPAFVALADKFNINKMVCRKCYATNPAKAKTCRKRKCGRCANLRPKKVSKD